MMQYYSDMSERIPATYIEVQDCDLKLEEALRKAYANNGPVVSLIAEFRERCLAKRNHGYLARIDTKEIEIVFAETAIMLLHPDESRRADAKERVYAILFRGDSTS